MVIVLAPTLGPTLGGYLTVHFGWRWIFFINIPVGVVSLFLSRRMIEDPPYLKAKEAEKTRIDYMGLALLVVGLGSLQVVLERGQRLDWFQSSLIVALAALSGCALIAFLVWEYFQQNPIIDLRLFKHRNFAVAFLMMGILAAILYGTLLMIPEFLQMMLRFNAEQAGAVLWPTALAVLPLLWVVGWVLLYVDARLLIAAGFLITAKATFHIAYNLNLSIS
jgi:DHA2 family multidrug resistance protein